MFWKDGALVAVPYPFPGIGVPGFIILYHHYPWVNKKNRRNIRRINEIHSTRKAPFESFDDIIIHRISNYIKLYQKNDSVKILWVLKIKVISCLPATLSVPH